MRIMKSRTNQTACRILIKSILSWWVLRETFFRRTRHFSKGSFTKHFQNPYSIYFLLLNNFRKCFFLFEKIERSHPLKESGKKIQTSTLSRIEIKGFPEDKIQERGIEESSWGKRERGKRGQRGKGENFPPKEDSSKREKGKGGSGKWEKREKDLKGKRGKGEKTKREISGKGRKEGKGERGKREREGGRERDRERRKELIQGGRIPKGYYSFFAKNSHLSLKGKGEISFCFSHEKKSKRSHPLKESGKPKIKYFRHFRILCQKNTNRTKYYFWEIGLESHQKRKFERTQFSVERMRSLSIVAQAEMIFKYFREFIEIKNFNYWLGLVFKAYFAFLMKKR